MKCFKLLISLSVCISVFSCTVDNNEKVEPLFSVVPNMTTTECSPGELSEVEKVKVLAYLNKIRDAHSLPHLTWVSKKEVQAQRAAIIVAANAEVSHTPSSEAHCYTSDGYEGCKLANLSLWGSSTSNWPRSEYHINEWMTDINSENIGYRRWILDPFLKSVTFGRIIGQPKRGEYKYVSSASLLYKVAEEANIVDLETEYIAYPQGTYNANLFDPNAFLSFAVLYDKVVKSNNTKVDFSAAQISVTVGAQDLIVKDISYDNTGFGLPNNLQWKVEGLTKNVVYTVKITDVLLDTETADYEYSFSYK